MPALSLEMHMACIPVVPKRYQNPATMVCGKWLAGKGAANYQILETIGNYDNSGWCNCGGPYKNRGELWGSCQELTRRSLASVVKDQTTTFSGIMISISYSTLLTAVVHPGFGAMDIG